MRARYLPKYVTSFVDRHGKERLRFRRKGFDPHYFAAPLGTEAFRTEYRLCMNPAERPVDHVVTRAKPGTIAALVEQYLAVPTRLGPTVTTQAKVRAIVDKFRTEHGDLPVDAFQFDHIDAIIAKKRVKRKVGKRIEGGVEAARKLRKELVRLFDFAIKKGMRDTNPATQSDKVKVAAGQKSTGYYSWTEDDIAQFRARHALGTKPRLAMELLLWTGQRRGDAIRMGRQHIRAGRINVVQGKSGKDLWIAVAPKLLEAIVAMPADGHLCFLVTSYGKPFSNAGFGNWFRDRCDEAGLPECTAHGLRKAIMRRMATLHLGNQTLKSVSGHSGDAEVAIYTQAANQVGLADDAIVALARWEKSNLSDGVDTNLQERFGNDA
jgi:integrase